MLEQNHIFALELLDTKGQVLGQTALNVNFEPAAEGVRFEAMRQSEVALWPTLAGAGIRVLPNYNGHPPYTAGFRLALTCAMPSTYAADFPLAWFKRMAGAASAKWVKEGKLAEGDEFQYKLLAFERTTEANSKAPAFSVDETPEPPAAVGFDIKRLVDRSEAQGNTAPGDAPVFIPRSIIEEVIQLGEAAGASETGGVLLGHLLRDSQGPELGVLITAQIPAQHTEAKCESLVFTERTWAAVDAAMTLRARSDEMICGWHHVHPSKYWCAKCPPESQLRCPLKQQDFLSGDDVALHETVFPRPFHVALLVTNAEDGPRTSLFGWRQGQVAQRGFYRLEEPVELPGAQAGKKE